MGGAQIFLKFFSGSGISVEIFFVSKIFANYFFSQKRFENFLQQSRRSLKSSLPSLNRQFVFDPLNMKTPIAR
jgi:hypothetical protein